MQDFHDIEEALLSVARDESGSVKTLIKVVRPHVEHDGRISLDHLPQYIVDALVRVFTEALPYCEPEVQAILAQLGATSSDGNPANRVIAWMARSSGYTVEQVIDMMRNEMVKPTRPPNSADPFTRESDEYRRERAKQARALRRNNTKWAKIEIELGENKRNLQRWVRDFPE